MRYLDHNATTPLDPRVRDVVIAALRDEGLQANPSSVHAPGQRARAVIEQARRAVARAVGAEPLEVTFTASGTEADNLAILGAARALRAAGRPCGVLTTAIEHPAVLAAAQALAREGHAVVLLAVDDRGRIEPGALAEALREHPDMNSRVLEGSYVRLKDVNLGVAGRHARRPGGAQHQERGRAVAAGHRVRNESLYINSLFQQHRWA